MEVAFWGDIAVSLFTLTLLELVLGVDNLIFIAVISARLPVSEQKKARRVGLMLAWVTRLLLLGAAFWLAQLTQPWLHVYSLSFSGRDLFLFLGGLFLLYKAITEIYAELVYVDACASLKPGASFSRVILQIALLDIIFSLDSVITAVGMTPHFFVMATAITLAIIGMIVASEPLSHWIHRYPRVKMLAFAFLVSVGLVLILDGLHAPVPKPMIYISVFFALIVEILNITADVRRQRGDHTGSETINV